jgi:hypothetical protein
LDPILLGDKEFDSSTATELDLVPPIRRRDRVDAARLEGLFGQRWQVETVNSAIKCKMGDAVRSRTERL